MSKRIIIILFLQFVSVNFLYADIEDVHIYYLDKEYDKAIEEARSILTSFSSRREAGEAYFYLGLSQMKLGYFKEARDSLRKIIKTFPNSAFGERAYLSVADCFFLEENFTKAVEIYESFLKEYPRSDLSNIAYFRLGQTNLKLGNWQIAKDHLNALRRKFPGSLEAQQAKELLARDNFFTVQVGAFINRNSAKALRDKLKDDGFDSYFVKFTTDDDKTVYRVRVGKLSKRYDTEALQAALALKGYPTRIYP